LFLVYEWKYERSNKSFKFSSSILSVCERFWERRYSKKEEKRKIKINKEIIDESNNNEIF